MAGRRVPERRLHPLKGAVEERRGGAYFARAGQGIRFSLENLTLDYSVAVKRSRQVSDRLVKGVGFLMKKNNIDVYMGAARVAKSDTVVVTDKDGKSSELKTKNIVVATGASRGSSAWLDRRRAKDRHLPGSDLTGKAAQSL